MRFCICFYLIGLVAQLSSQFYVIDDFGYPQAKGENIIEHDAHMYVTGVLIDSFNTGYKMVPGIHKFDLDGTHLNSFVYNNDRERTDLCIVNDSSVSIYNDQILLNVIFGASEHDAVIMMDTSLREITYEFVYTNPHDYYGIVSESHLALDNRLIVPLTFANQNNLATLDLDEKTFSFGRCVLSSSKNPLSRWAVIVCQWGSWWRYQRYCSYDIGRESQ